MCITDLTHLESVSCWDSTSSLLSVPWTLSSALRLRRSDQTWSLYFDFLSCQWLTPNHWLIFLLYFNSSTKVHQVHGHYVLMHAFYASRNYRLILIEMPICQLNLCLWVKCISVLASWKHLSESLWWEESQKGGPVRALHREEGGGGWLHSQSGPCWVGFAWACLFKRLRLHMGRVWCSSSLSLI